MDCNFVPINRSQPAPPPPVVLLLPQGNIGMQYRPLVPVCNMTNQYPRCTMSAPSAPYVLRPAYVQSSGPLVYNYTPVQLAPQSPNAMPPTAQGPCSSTGFTPSFSQAPMGSTVGGVSSYAENYEPNGYLAGGAVRGARTPSVQPQSLNQWHCDLCDLRLTSMTHAEQHYNGRRHKMVAAGIWKPSGSGYYDREGNWVRTNLKCEPSDVWCNVCLISTPSKSHMDLHVLGAKHAKNIKRFGFDAKLSMDQDQARDTFRGFCGSLDPSVFHTPAGFFCRTCKLQFSHLMCLKQHLDGKRHRKATARGTQAAF